MGTFSAPLHEPNKTNSITMAALSAVAPVIAKAPVVTTTKSANANSMMVWNPSNNKFFETFSFLPPLSDAEIARQIQYLLNNGWSGIDSNVNAGYYDNRYWVMWKLPMYGCTNPDEVLTEVNACKAAFPECFIRVAGFDNIKQVQCSSFLAHRPSSDRSFAPVNGRQVGGGGAGVYGSAAPAPAPPAGGNQNYSW